MSLAVPVMDGPGWVRLAANSINTLSQRKQNAVSATAAHTVADGEDVILGNATGAAFTVLLPALATWTGKTVTIKKVDASANAVTIDGNGAETIDGAATLALGAQYAARTLVAGPTEWNVIGKA